MRPCTDEGNQRVSVHGPRPTELDAQILNSVPNGLAGMEADAVRTITSDQAVTLVAEDFGRYATMYSSTLSASAFGSQTSVVDLGSSARAAEATRRAAKTERMTIATVDGFIG